MTLPPLSDTAKELKTGIYQHYSGKCYLVLDVGRYEENLEEVVIYQAEDKGDIWVRPLVKFVETVELPDGSTCPRFKCLEV